MKKQFVTIWNNTPISHLDSTNLEYQTACALIKSLPSKDSKVKKNQIIFCSRKTCTTTNFLEG